MAYTPKVEVLEIAVKNVIPELAQTPNTNTVQMAAVGAPSEPGTHFTVSDKVITWDEVAAGYDLEVGDKCIVAYSYGGSGTAGDYVEPTTILETLTVKTRNTLRKLMYIPTVGEVTVVADGNSTTEGVEWSIIDRQITWDEATAGYGLEVDNIVVVNYPYI